MKFNQAVNIYIRIIPALGFFLFISVISAYIYPRKNLQISTDPSFWGAFGDFVGGVLNPIFAIFTLIGLVLTIRLQMQIFGVQKQELVATRTELKKSAEALEIQNSTMRSQNFEGTFFQMLRRQQELLKVVEDISHTNGGRPNGINMLIGDIVRNCNSGIHHEKAYSYTYDRYGASLGPYFRNMYHTLKLIDSNKYLTEDEKITYSNLFRAQFSSKELAVIFYNCLSEFGVGLKPLIIKYRMLKHISVKLIANPEWLSDSNFYPLETYTARD